ncbi:hypothetical protein ACFPRL_27085 [Pseudoclavibacter helvolus]
MPACSAAVAADSAATCAASPCVLSVSASFRPAELVRSIFPDASRSADEYPSAPSLPSMKASASELMECWIAICCSAADCVPPLSRSRTPLRADSRSSADFAVSRTTPRASSSWRCATAASPPEARISAISSEYSFAACDAPSIAACCS